VVAFTARIYGISPKEVAEWRPGEVYRWYEAGIEVWRMMTDDEQVRLLKKAFG
jgi:O-acetyl-ADP-ribose deacetylase (regulator of RNase III)